MISNRSDIQIHEKIQEMSPQLGGIFTTADLFHLIGATTSLTNMRAIDRIVKAGILSRCQRGFYVTKNFDLWLLAARLLPKGYISLDSILAKRQLVGTSPTAHVSVIAMTPSKTISARDKVIRVYSLAEDLFFGFEKTQQGIAEADNEKAFLDLLYYYNHGRRFAFDPLSEIRLSKLDLGKTKHYLKRYKNPKFVTFVKGVLNER